MQNPWNEAWEEAEATAPPHVVLLPTLELRHVAFIEGGEQIAIRVVNGPADDMEFTLEDNAPMQPGETVLFKAIPFFAERPEVSEGRLPESQVTIDNVAREMIPILEEAVKVRADLIVAYREYRSDDLTAPCYGPVEFKMRKVTMSGATLTGVARLEDLATRKFPARVYTINDYPGLLGS